MNNLKEKIMEYAPIVANMVDELLNEEYTRILSLGLGYKETILQDIEGTAEIENEAGEKETVKTIEQKEVANPMSRELYIAMVLLENIVEISMDGIRLQSQKEMEAKIKQDIDKLL